MHQSQQQAEQSSCAGSCRSCPAVGSCPDRIVCRCLRVREETIISAITTLGIRTLRELRVATEAGDGCTCCHAELTQYVAVYSPSSLSSICSAK